MTEDTQKDSGRTTKRVRLSSEMSVLAFQQRICPKCKLPVIPGLEKCPRDGASLKQQESGGHSPVTAPRGEILQMSDRYDHLGSLGSGGMSVVYKARDKVLDRVVAIKQLISVVNSDQAIVRFQREACAYAALKHPNIVNVFDFGIDEENRPFLVMDFLEGQTLDEVIAERNGLSVPETLEIFIQILDGLSHAHQKGIIHRDLKPANVMIQRFGSSQRIQVKIMDFGIAKVKVKDPQAAWQTQTGQVMGSPLYMSPEQSASSANVDGRADIYSVGCMLFEAMTCRPPFCGGSVVETVSMHRNETPPKMTELIPKRPVIAGVPSMDEFGLDMEAIVYAAIEKKADDRYQSAADMRADLLCVQENWNKISQSGGTKSGASLKSPSKSLKVGALVAFVLLSIGGGALIYANMDQKPSKPTTQASITSFVAKREEPVEAHCDHWIDFNDVTHKLLPEEPLSSIAQPKSVRALQVGQFLARAKVSKAEEESFKRKFETRLEGLETLQSLKSLQIWNLPVTDRNVVTISKMRTLSRVGFIDTTVPHNIVKVLHTLPKLETLELKMCQLTAKDILDLPQFSSLHKLSLDDNQIGKGNGLAPLGKCEGLIYLALNNAEIDDESVRHLSLLPYLRTLMMERTELTAAGCKTLAKLPSLISLNLGFSPKLDDQAVKELGNMKQLEALNLQSCKKVTDKCVPDILRLQNMMRLDLTNTGITDQALKDLRKGLPKLRVLKHSSKVEEINAVFVDNTDLGSSQK